MKEKNENGSTNSRPANGTNEVFSMLEIQNSENDVIYHNVGKYEHIKELVEKAKEKFQKKGYKIKSLNRGNYWKATENNEYEDIYIAVKNLEWCGLEKEINLMVECIEEYFEV